VQTQGRLCDLDGNLVESDRRAETMATFLEQNVWSGGEIAVPPDREPIFPELALELGDISDEEFKRAARAMKHGKASGPDSVPSEFLTTLFV